MHYLLGFCAFFISANALYLLGFYAFFISVNALYLLDFIIFLASSVKDTIILHFDLKILVFV